MRSASGKVAAKKGVTGQLRFVASVADQQLPLELPVVLRTVVLRSERRCHRRLAQRQAPTNAMRRS